MERASQVNGRRRAAREGGAGEGEEGAAEATRAKGRRRASREGDVGEGEEGAPEAMQAKERRQVSGAMRVEPPGGVTGRKGDIKLGPEEGKGRSAEASQANGRRGAARVARAKARRRAARAAGAKGRSGAQGRGRRGTGAEAGTDRVFARWSVCRLIWAAC